MNYYDRFIKPKEIKHDINFFFNQIKDLICNDIFSQFICDSRKKINKTYKIENYLSKFYKTKLQFSNDVINIEFITISEDILMHVDFPPLVKIDGNHYCINVTWPKFKSYKYDGLIMNIKILLKEQEYSNKIIYDNNPIFNEIRKTISNLYKNYCQSLNNKEKSKYKYIHSKLINVKKSHYEVWNDLLKYVIDIIDPSFENKLKKVDKIVSGVRSSNYLTTVQLIHNTEFYIQNNHYRQIKINKFLKKLRKNCLDENEVMNLTNDISYCFNHKLKNYKESMEFLINITDHYNYKYKLREKNIDDFVYKIWNKNNKSD